MNEIQHKRLGISVFKLASIFLLLTFQLLPSSLEGSPDIKHMRAVHAMGNWGGDTQGFKTPMLQNAGALSAQAIEVQVSRSSFVDGQGKTQTNDLAQVKLTNARIGNNPVLPLAGFWVYKNVGTGSIGIQFRASIDTNLAAVKGFSSDINVTLTSGEFGKFVFVDSLEKTSGDALNLIRSVLAFAPEALKDARFTVTGGAVFGGSDSLAPALAEIRTILSTGDENYFNFLKSMNVEWVGISIAMHYDSLANSTVVARVCPDGSMLDSGGFNTSCAFPDADLLAFIARAKARGFKIYLTLAFESSKDLDAVPGASCGTASYKMSRWILGRPTLEANSPQAKCIATSDWWWAPSHPLHAANTATFFSTYTQVAVKYATLAQQAGVELYSLGTETDFLFRTRPAGGPMTNDFKPQLLQMVAAVRAVYSGLLTYDQNVDTLQFPNRFYGGQGQAQLFNDLGLDVVGLSAYFSLINTSPNKLMTAAELDTAWEAIFVNYLEPLQKAYPGKPIVFTEFGYVDHINAPHDPAIAEGVDDVAYNGSNATAGMLQQQNIYEAFYSVNARHNDVVAGTFLWGNDYYPNFLHACSKINWTLACRPARTTIADHYAKWRAKDAERVFAWAEKALPEYFPPTGATGAAQGYVFRFYPTTGNYLATKDERVILHNGNNWKFFDVGTLRQYLDMAAAQGY